MSLGEKELIRKDRKGTPWTSPGKEKPIPVEDSIWFADHDPDDPTRIISWHRKTIKRIEQDEIDAQDAQAPDVDLKKMGEDFGDGKKWTDH